MVEGTQLYPYADGTIREAADWKAPGQKDQEDVMRSAFAGYASGDYEHLEPDGPIKRVLLKSDNGNMEIYYYRKAVSGGGRPKSRPDELRIQIDPANWNRLVEINRANRIGLVAGVYINGEAKALALWRPMERTDADGNISKQVAGKTIANALANGLAKEVYPGGDTTVYVIRPTLFRGFVGNITDFDNKQIKRSQMAENITEKQRDLIYFGAPGTGKSHNLDERVKEEFDKDKVRRVTFHPDYTYAQFVGSLKPYSDPNDGNKISYKYISGPFLETYLDAIAHPNDEYVLVVEELNRANPAAVFGDVFQLLDRNNYGESKYAIAVSKEMSNCIAEYLGRLTQDEIDYLESYYDDLGFEGFQELSLAHLGIPSNMYIWATMNSADQGVYPMDTAFKRRWDFEYIGIDDGEAKIEQYEVPIGKTGKTAKWNDLRKGINKKLIDAKVNEDKLIGPFFIAPSVLGDSKRFNEVFKNKVLLYLFEDAAKTKKGVFFTGNVETYSSLCKLYDEGGPEAIISEITVDGQNDTGEATADNTNGKDGGE